MGIIAVLLYANGMLGGDFYVPLWVVLACHAAMGLGTLTGGWRIVRTMGMSITKLKPVGGFCAETGGAITLFLATGSRHPGVDDAHHHRRDRRRRLGDERLGRALGRRRPHRLGLDLHHSVRGVHLRPDVDDLPLTAADQLGRGLRAAFGNSIVAGDRRGSGSRSPRIEAGGKSGLRGQGGR